MAGKIPITKKTTPKKIPPKTPAKPKGKKGAQLGSQKCTDEQVIEAIRKRNGKLYLAAADLRISYVTIYNYSKRSEAIRDAIHEAKGNMLDTAEDKLFRAIRKNQAWAICFFLKCMGKDRGFTERSEYTGANGKPINLQHEINSSEVLTKDDLSKMSLEARRELVTLLEQKTKAKEESDNKKVDTEKVL